MFLPTISVAVLLPVKNIVTPFIANDAIVPNVCVDDADTAVTLNPCEPDNDAVVKASPLCILDEVASEKAPFATLVTNKDLPPFWK